MQVLLDQIRAAKMLTRVFARDQRAVVFDIERQVEALCDQVDAFYNLLGPRNWVYTDTFPTEMIGALVDLPAAEAEQALIGWYKEPDTLRCDVMKFNGLPALRVRLQQVERAREDFAAGRYYSTVQGLISVMDGFVNDVEPDRRRGMHARDPDEMQAWDSVVGHHLGLAHAHKSFTKTFKKTVTDEVFELHRHGIVHGMILNFDNEVVASKAWNWLFAVADWARSKEKAAIPKKPEKSWLTILREATETSRSVEEQREALAAWRPSVLEPGDGRFDGHEVVARTIGYLDAWKARNYGQAASYLSPMAAEDTPGKTAGRVREELAPQPLSSYTIERVHNSAAAVSEVDVTLVINGQEADGRLRWIRVDQAAIAAAPNMPGTWGLMWWGPMAMINARRREAS
jgi:hypothetical protein